MSNANIASYNKPVYGAKGLSRFSRSSLGKDMSVPYMSDPAEKYRQRRGHDRALKNLGFSSAFRRGIQKQLKSEHMKNRRRKTYRRRKTSGKRYGARRTRRSKRMTRGLMLGFKPIDSIPPAIYLKNCRPGSYRWLEMIFKSSPEEMLHNLAAYAQRMKAYRALNMLAVVHTRMPYQRYNQCSQDVQASCRQMWAVLQNYIVEHKCKILDPVARSEYRIQKLAELARKQATLAEDIEKKMKELGVTFTGSLPLRLNVPAGGFGAAAMGPADLSHDMGS